MSIGIADIEQQDTDQISYIEPERLHADEEFNSRGRIDPIDIVDLVNSIRQSGLLQPIVVYPYNDKEKLKHGKEFKIILGFRRFMACQSLGMKTIKCIVRAWMDENQARVLNLIENIRRENLNIVQEAQTLQKFKIAGWTRAMVAEKLGMSPAWVQNRFNVLSFPEDIQKECANGTLNQIHIKEIYSLPLEKQYEAVRKIKDQRLKGEKHIRVAKPVTTNSKKARTPASVRKMQDFIYDELGPSFATRCLAWTRGDISSLDLFTDIKKQKEARGENFILPEEDF
jgi:ParB family chromosome partitioning protein